jgi:cysteine desulfuration protein SufE
MSILESWEDKYGYIMELGDGLPAMDDSDRVEENLVSGCVSRVWMVMRREGGRFYFLFDSDAMIVKGLLYIVRSLFDGCRGEEVLARDAGEVFGRLGLSEKLSPNRRNGLFSVVARIKEEVNELA